MTVVNFNWIPTVLLFLFIGFAQKYNLLITYKYNNNIMSKKCFKINNIHCHINKTVIIVLPHDYCVVCSTYYTPAIIMNNFFTSWEWSLFWFVIIILTFTYHITEYVQNLFKTTIKTLNLTIWVHCIRVNGVLYILKWWHIWALKPFCLFFRANIYKKITFSCTSLRS